MNRAVLWGMTFFLVFSSSSSLAQGRGGGRGRGPAMWRRGCVPLEALDLSGKQQEAINKIETHYSERILQLRNELMTKRFGLRDLLRDPEAGDQTIRTKAGELRDLHRALQEKMIDYQLEIRAVLTPDQMKRWCTMVGGGPSRKGWKRGP